MKRKPTLISHPIVPIKGGKVVPPPKKEVKIIKEPPKSEAGKVIPPPKFGGGKTDKQKSK